jgi:hypothetical protein
VTSPSLGFLGKAILDKLAAKQPHRHPGCKERVRTRTSGVRLGCSSLRNAQKSKAFPRPLAGREDRLTLFCYWHLDLMSSLGGFLVKRRQRNGHETTREGGV